jgi:hypothetical protein
MLPKVDWISLHWRIIAAVILAVITFTYTIAAHSSSPDSCTSPTPNITSAYVQPTKVVPGDVMLVTAAVEDPTGIATITADMGGIETIELDLVSGSIYQGVWQAKWKVHDTEVREYITTITATNVKGETSSISLTWSDPPTWWNPSWRYRKEINVT